MNYFLYAMIYIFVFMIGVTVFAYMNLVIERLPKKEKLTIRHSHCKQCDHEQTWKDVIPIFSRIRYQNRCRYCGSVLPKRPLIIELVGGAFAVFSVAMYGIHLSALLFFLVICDLMVITMIDADTQEIPPQLNVILLLLGIPAIWVLPGPTIIERVIYLLASKKKGRKEHFAFGPFLAFGVLVALTQNLGDTMISMYIDYVKSMMTATY